MNFKARFEEDNAKFVAKYGALNDISDGGYERGYNEGYNKGHTDGLAQRKYETWTFTLTDGTVVEKEVALL